MQNLFDVLQQDTPFTSTLANKIATTMKGNTFHHHILYTLRSLINKEVAVYTEIGTFNGGSLCLMLQHPSPVKCVSVDPFHLDRTTVQIVNDNITTFNKHNYDVELTKKFSTDSALLDDLKKRNFKTDILFIDGDHSYNAVIQDFNNFNEFVSEGGYIVFDDYQDSKYSPEVKPAVDNIVKSIVDKQLPFKIFGSPPNFNNVYPSQLINLNEFILQKL